MKNNLSVQSLATQTDRFLIGCCFFVFFATLVWAVFFVPMNMDEAGIFHVLACSNYPFASLHTFREACMHQNDLYTPLGIRISHPEFYTGIWHTLLYAPFYYMLHTPGAQYVFGLIFFAAFAALLSRESKKPLLSLALYLSFFPFLFQFIHDMGPVKFVILLYPLSAYLFRKIVHTPAPLSFAYAVLLAIVCVCATEEKPFFLYILPSIALFTLAFASENRLKELKEVIKTAWAPLYVAAAFGFVGLLLLFCSKNQDGVLYGRWLVNLAQQALPLREWLNSFFDFMSYWPSYAHNFYALQDDLLGVIFFRLALIVFIVFCVIAAIDRRFTSVYAPLRLQLLLGSFLVTGVVFLCVRNEWAGHHFIFLWVPLIVLFADLVAVLRPGMAMAAVAGFLILNLWSVIALTQATETVRSSSERAALFAYFDNEAVASHAIINYSSWGGYYIQSLYGPKDQLVTYTEPYGSEQNRTASLEPQDARQLLALAEKTGRRIYNICYGPLCNKAALEAIYGNHTTFEEIMPGLPNWHIFGALPRKDG